MTVRAVWPRPRRYSASRSAIRRSSSCSRSRSRDVAREGLLMRDRDALDRAPRAGAGRCRGRGRAPCGRPCRASARAGRRRRARPGRRSSRSRPRAAAPRRAGPIPGSSRIGEAAPGTRPPGPAGTIVSPPGLRRSEAILATTFEVARPSEHESRVRARITACTDLGERARVVEGRRDLAEVEVALVDAGLLHRRARPRARATRPRASTRGRATCAA